MELISDPFLYRIGNDLANLGVGLSNAPFALACRRRRGACETIGRVDAVIALPRGPPSRPGACSSTRASGGTTRQPPGRSTPGIILAALSLIVMPVLVRFKRRVATRLGSGALEAEARQTRVCAYLSGVLLAGLGLNAWLGWWWADPAAGIAMVPLIGWEGWQALSGRTCCAD